MRGKGKPWGVFCLALARDRHASMAPTEASSTGGFRYKKAARCAAFSSSGSPYYALFSAIFFFQMTGPVLCTDSPSESTATVTGMSSTSNS